MNLSQRAGLRRFNFRNIDDPMAQRSERSRTEGQELHFQQQICLTDVFRPPLVHDVQMNCEFQDQPS